MKTRAALALSVAGILVTGSAALAVNTQVLNTTPAGTGNANSVLLPDNPGRTPVPAVASAKATPAAASVAGRSTAPATRTAAPESRDSKGGDRKGSRRAAATPEPGDGNGGTVTGHDDAGPASSLPSGTVGFPPDAGPAVPQPAVTAGSRPAVTAGSQPAAANPAVVVQPADDKGGRRKAPEPGDDGGSHGSDD